MSYATWEFYTTVFLGNAIAEDDFPMLALRASEIVDDVTRGRAQAFYDKCATPVSKAVCAVAEIMVRQQAAMAIGEDGSARVASESNDGFSVSYEKGINPDSKDGQEAFNAQIHAAIATYLRATGLLYRGVGLC